MADDRYREREGRRGPGRSDSIFGSGDRGGRDGERGFFERAGEQVRSWLGDEERGGSGSGSSEWDRQEPWGAGGWQSGQSGAGRSGGHPLDDHYRSWRDRQIAQLDREYEEYCRHRQQQFETDFHSWREGRQSGGTAGVRDAQATSTSTGGTGLGADASFGSSNSDAGSSDTGSESAPKPRTNLP